MKSYKTWSPRGACAKRYVIPPERQAMLDKTSLFSLEKALSGNYVMEPHVPTGSFVNEPGYCALRYAAYSRMALGDNNPVPNCAVKCEQCASICHMNDYIRGKLPPHYPVPALL